MFYVLLDQTLFVIKLIYFKKCIVEYIDEVQYETND